ncbi:MAG: cytochrome c oxidase assembly protein [Hyphomicrobiales bacterium]|nr:cytochrome c oxidase assembly protein [Hyphomicrobiales bacterium]
MTAGAHIENNGGGKSNTRLVVWLVALVVGMTALSFAAVPLYRLFCQVTGYGGTTQRAEAAPGVTADRVIRVRFDANVAPGLPWAFHPEMREIDVKVGESKLGFYRVVSQADHATVGTASFNVTPEIAGKYFAKIECFCFQEQRLEGRASAEMPVSFYVDPAIMDDRDAAGLTDITLSYTFFATPESEKTAGQSKAGSAKGVIDLSGREG